MSNDRFKYLAWFLGPKAENGRFFENLLVDTFRDYAHWRKNYFPEDPILISQGLKNVHQDERSILETKHAELLAKLRRNFPFYSPRYIAHELSDTTMPAMLGYFAGMLYNPNNVTPEAAPVTTELEIEVSSEICRMLGFRAPPPPPEPGTDPLQYYSAPEQSREFAWAHLTSGGTVANIEALWVARQVRYFPISVKLIAAKYGLELSVKLANGNTTRLVDANEYDLLFLRSNESIYLLPRLVDALHKGGHLAEGPDKLAQTWKILESSGLSITNGFSELFAKYPPVVFVASSSHYSVAKAVNLLGMGGGCIHHVRMDSKFRLDVDDLKRQLLALRQTGRAIPLCVIASAGTTEEGAVDPIHEIVKLRDSLQREQGISFWLHVDAAWGGYIRSLVNLDDYDRAEAICVHVAKLLRLVPPQIQCEPNIEALLEWHEHFSAKLMELAAMVSSASTEDAHLPTPSEEGADHSGIDNKDRSVRTRRLFSDVIESELLVLQRHIESGEFSSFVQMIRKLLIRFKGKGALGPELEKWLRLESDSAITLEARLDWVGKYVREEVTKRHSWSQKCTKILTWPERNVGAALVAFARAESITVDPHKMGYAPYPAGCIAFRNDLVRNFILQRAPYITAAERNELVHVPPRHRTRDGQIVTASFSPFMLEGSRPGAVASALWLSMQCLPYTPRGHGAIVRASILSARLLHERLKAWDEDAGFLFIPLTAESPDTNLVTFVVAPTVKPNLARLNELSRSVYRSFSILAELGDREHSYSQAFFLSNTNFR
jgi:glutamate/tyrosine decarboxylase-like PLP-dependent enzyme